MHFDHLELDEGRGTDPIVHMKEDVTISLGRGCRQPHLQADFDVILAGENPGLDLQSLPSGRQPDVVGLGHMLESLPDSLEAKFGETAGGLPEIF